MRFALVVIAKAVTLAIAAGSVSPSNSHNWSESASERPAISRAAISAFRTCRLPRLKTPRRTLTCGVGALAASCALAFATVATGHGMVAAQPLASEAQQLEPVAAAIAGRPLTVLCYLHGEPGDPLLWGGWSYVDLFRALARPTSNGSAIGHDYTQKGERSRSR
jgi:hypothetical protein